MGTVNIPVRTLMSKRGRGIIIFGRIWHFDCISINLHIDTLSLICSCCSYLWYWELSVMGTVSNEAKNINDSHAVCTIMGTMLNTL